MSAESVTPLLFSMVSALEATGRDRFEGRLDPEWTIGGKPNGGYLLSMMGRAATWDRVHDHVVAASAHYLRSPEPGPVVIATEVLRAGRSATQVRARMEQDGKPCVEAVITASHLDPATVPSWDKGLPPAPSLPYEACPRLVPQLPNGMRVAIMDHVEIRLEPETSRFTAQQPGGRGELRGWLSLPGGEDLDPASLLYAVDSFPPATFDIEFSGWVPTLELTVYVRALPVPGPVRLVQRAGLIDAGRVDETCLVWDTSGRLVAQATQLAGVRL